MVYKIKLMNFIMICKIIKNKFTTIKNKKLILDGLRTELNFDFMLYASKSHKNKFCKKKT
jgi:hypothetical protein